MILFNQPDRLSKFLEYHIKNFVGKAKTFQVTIILTDKLSTLLAILIKNPPNLAATDHHRFLYFERTNPCSQKLHNYYPMYLFTLQT